MTSEIKNIKILYLVKTMEVGGAERFTLNLAAYFAGKAESVTVASAGGIFVDILKKKGIKHIQLKNEPVISKLIPLYFELKRLIRANDYTVIHCQHRILTFVLQFLRKGKFFHIYTAHNVFNDIFQKIIFPDIAVAVSKTIKLNLQKTSYIDKNRIEQINNGVQIPSLKKSGNDIITFGFIGRLIKEKGIFDLLEAIKQLNTENTKFRLIIRGKGEIEKITDFVRINNLGSFVLFADVSNDEDEIYKSIDILILPSKMNEGMPLSILEAAARGILVVTTRSGGIEDFIANGKTGILLDSTEPEILAGAIKIILANYNSYNEIIENALSKVKDDFSIEKMTLKYEKLYSKYLPVTSS